MGVIMLRSARCSQCQHRPPHMLFLKSLLLLILEYHCVSSNPAYSIDVMYWFSLSKRRLSRSWVPALSLPKSSLNSRRGRNVTLMGVSFIGFCIDQSSCGSSVPCLCSLRTSSFRRKRPSTNNSRRWVPSGCSVLLFAPKMVTINALRGCIL